MASKAATAILLLLAFALISTATTAYAARHSAALPVPRTPLDVGLPSPAASSPALPSPAKRSAALPVPRPPSDLDVGGLPSPASSVSPAFPSPDKRSAALPVPRPPLDVGLPSLTSVSPPFLLPAKHSAALPVPRPPFDVDLPPLASSVSPAFPLPAKPSAALPVPRPPLDMGLPSPAWSVSPAFPSPAAAAATTTCVSSLLELSPCLSFFKDAGSIAAPAGCCAGLRTIVDSQAVCLCHIISHTLERAIGVAIPVDRALTLLGDICGVAPPQDTFKSCSNKGGVPPLYACPAPSA